ncbi:GntR family transcriptional regulator [Sulfitobacter albidus]|uniref:GntR family transcriptional regulator n=1 Tax=Sulfitobacter albidus TaxID=2829501 RepID=A0A975PL23_9RHOB|nr:GntR family transcriptional regulator [Sulfitobacter albidus]QUJ75229.1 GntR family transcriptional regulator [Sulfitobacter albidus]
MPTTPRHRKAALIAALREAILTQALLPGADLDEVALSERYGLSRTPLREALRELAGEGYVDLRENRGARVAEMGHTTLRDFFLAAPMIYGAVLRLAAAHRTGDQLQALRAAQADFRTALGATDTAARALANTAFHDITGQMAGNVYLLPSFRRLLIDHTRISMTFYGADRVETATAADQHDTIIDAIHARDGEAAAALAQAHWRLSSDQIAQFVMPAPLTGTLGTPAPDQRTP